MTTQEAKWQKFLKSFPVIMRQKSQILLFQGEAPRFAHVVKKGVIKTYNVSGQGVEQLVSFQSDFEVFPFTWVWGKAPSALYYYEALTDCEVYCVPREDYLKFVKSDSTLLAAELEKYAHHEVGHTLRLNALLNLKARDKLIHTLHYLAQTHGQPVGKGIVKINLGLTQQDFANLIGITRETAATELNKLKKKGAIYYSPGAFYQIDLDKINQLLNDQFIAEIEDILTL
jgi:CRP/FNR family transcriptional regulator, cyclic AMP receptor protein